jgi:hypothetical protein
MANYMGDSLVEIEKIKENIKKKSSLLTYYHY